MNIKLMIPMALLALTTACSSNTSPLGNWDVQSMSLGGQEQDIHKNDGDVELKLTEKTFTFVVTQKGEKAEQGGTVVLDEANHTMILKQVLMDEKIDSKYKYEIDGNTMTMTMAPNKAKEQEGVVIVVERK